jgi:hypothetical protein
MEQNSSEANSSPTGQEIPRNLWNLKVHYRVHKSHPFVLSQMNPFHALPSRCFCIHYNAVWLISKEPW